MATIWNFTANSFSVIKALDGASPPREQSFNALSLRMVDGIIYLYEYGLYASSVKFEQIGTIDAVSPTDLQDAYDKILAIIPTGGATIQTLQQVLDNNHDLAENNNFQGTGAGENSLGTDINAFGQFAAQNYTGTDVNAFGQFAAAENTGNNVNAYGLYSAEKNTGSDVNAFGTDAAKENSAVHVNALGTFAGKNNTSKSVNLFGFEATADADNQTVFSKWLGGVNKYLGRLSFNNITADRKWELPNQTGALTVLDTSSNYASDVLAAAGGIPVGGLYHTAGAVKIRLV